MSKKFLAATCLLFFFSSLAAAVKEINLPQPKNNGKISLEETIQNRRSVRDYTPREISIDQLAQLLWAAQGITDRDFNFRAAPSAGAIYPLTIYVASKDGVFKYDPLNNKLVEHLSEDLRPSILRASLGQAAINQAPVSFIITANGYRTREKFGARTYRYLCLEAGHVAENINLQAVALGLCSISIGSFWDDVVAKVLKLPYNEEPLYIIPIGYQG